MKLIKSKEYKTIQCYNCENTSFKIFAKTKDYGKNSLGIFAFQCTKCDIILELEEKTK